MAGYSHEVSGQKDWPKQMRISLKIQDLVANIRGLNAGGVK